MNKIFFLMLMYFAANLRADIVYLDPIPGARYINIDNNITIGSDVPFNRGALNTLLIKVSGSKSGLQEGTPMLTDNNTKLVYKLDKPFVNNEEVKVELVLPGYIFKQNLSHNISYSFYTESERKKRRQTGRDFDNPMRKTGDKPEDITPDSPSQELPELTVTASDNPSEGKIFLSAFTNGISYMTIADNTGTPILHKKMQGNATDFKIQEDNTLSYFDPGKRKFYRTDTDFNIIDSFYMGNGYTTNSHELILLPGGHALLMAYDPQPVDMSGIVPGGNENAVVTGLVVQEIDENKNVLFQWRSWDHYEITDATHEDLTAMKIDYVHGNALDIDTDGNILISARHMDEITKIDRSSGEIIWRLGGKNNEFTFINDSIGFSHQHAIRRIDNGNITLYDNGNFHSPQFSRAVEYSLDEKSKTATLVWEYRNNPDIFGKSMGYVQRLDNGNTLIAWGRASTTLTEVTPEGTIALEMNLPQKIYTYRAYKFDWDSYETGKKKNL